VTLGASANSGLSVTYTVVGPATLSGTMLTATAPGTLTLAAYQNGDASWESAEPVMQTVLVFAPPEIVVEQPAGTGLTSGVSEVDFGGVVPGVAALRSFTLKNIGTADLNLTGTQRVAVSGSAAFSVTQQPASATVTMGVTQISRSPLLPPRRVRTARR
jgi:hypothetical protein